MSYVFYSFLINQNVCHTLEFPLLNLKRELKAKMISTPSFFQLVSVIEAVANHENHKGNICYEPNAHYPHPYLTLTILSGSSLEREDSNFCYGHKDPVMIPLSLVRLVDPCRSAPRRLVAGIYWRYSGLMWGQALEG